MGYKYSFQGFDKDHMARACGTNLPISVKHSVVVCRHVRGRTVERAKKILQESADLIRPIPFTTNNHGVGHKPGIGPGRFIVNTCQEILKIIESAESNAVFKGMSSKDLIVKHIMVNKGPPVFHGGRKRRSLMKRAHIEVVLEETKIKKDDKSQKKDVKKEAKKESKEKAK